MSFEALSVLSGTGNRVQRGTLVGIGETGVLLVEIEGEPRERFRCDWLETSADQAIRLEVGDEVLVLPPDEAGGRGCVLGRVGRYTPPIADPVEHATAPPEVLHLEADQQIVLSCGESALILRRDGKVLIRGVDVVSRATQTQRIKGGSVQIN